MIPTEDTDSLMAELNGVAATPQEAQELADAKDATAANPLIVPPAKPLTAVQKAEAKARKIAGDNPLRGYAVTVEGDYAEASTDVPGKKVKRPYSIVVNLPHLEGALSTIKNKLLGKMLSMKYPGYITFLTHKIVNVKPLTPETPAPNNIAFMEEKQLKEFISSHDVPVSLGDYKDDLPNLRAAVVDFMLNPKDFKKREEKRLVSIKEDRELEEMNK